MAKHNALYLGWDNPNTAIRPDTRVPVVVLIHDDGRWAVLQNDPAMEFLRLHTEITHHICGVQKQQWVFELIEKVGKDIHSCNLYNHIFDQWLEADHNARS